MSRHLRLVTETERLIPRVYVFGVEAMDFLAQINCLVDLGYDVINRNEIRDLEEITLREHLRSITGAEILAVPDLWWTSVAGHQLLQVAGWLRMPLLNENGDQIPTSSVGASG